MCAGAEVIVKPSTPDFRQAFVDLDGSWEESFTDHCGCAGTVETIDVDNDKDATSGRAKVRLHAPVNKALFYPTENLMLRHVHHGPAAAACPFLRQAHFLRQAARGRNHAHPPQTATHTHTCARVLGVGRCVVCHGREGTAQRETRRRGKGGGQTGSEERAWVVDVEVGRVVKGVV